MPLAQDIMTIGAGSLVGFTLGLIGSGGSILAVPLLVYAVGVSSPHVAIGTGAVAVAASASANLFGHARAHTVKWPCAIVFAASGVAGAAAGAALGKMIDGGKLLVLFGALMIVVGALMLVPRKARGNPDVRLRSDNAWRLVPLLTGAGLVVGALSGFFGIGGGFLIVPGLVGVTAMPLVNAIGSSLVSVTAFGTTAAASYALSGLVDWKLAALFVGGGVIGSIVGLRLNKHLSHYQRALSYLFASVVIAAGCYVVGVAMVRA